MVNILRLADKWQNKKERIFRFYHEFSLSFNDTGWWLFGLFWTQGLTMNSLTFSDIGGSRAQPRKIQKDRATETQWTSFLSKDTSKVITCSLSL